MISVPGALRERLRQHGQEHVLAFWEDLDEDGRRTLISQLETIDLDQLRKLYDRRNKPEVAPSSDRIEPAPFVAHDDTGNGEKKVLGEDLLRKGAVAALVVAGGQGSRLGFEHPKGMYEVGPVSRKSLFQVHAEKVLALGRRYGQPVPLLVMTSPATHEETQAFFREKRYFGLAEGEVFFFCQGTMPALDLATGKLLLEAPGRLFLSPDGHGGTLTALASSGLLERMRTRGVEQVFYFQVDNPLVKIADPTFLGHHAAAGSEVSSKVIAKRGPKEKVGVLAKVDGRCAIVEYSDLPDELAHAADETGRLRLWAGNPAIHLFSVDFLERMTRDPERLAFHVAKKKVPHIDAEGQPVEPGKENALKFERFIFDVLPAAEHWLIVESTRAEEFAPLKNATGDDSPATVEQALVAQAADWVAKAGGTVSPGSKIEISPLFALDAEEFARKAPGVRVEGTRYFE